MSLLFTFICKNLIHAFEEELIGKSPEIKTFALNEFLGLGNQLVDWAEQKLNIDINGDGKIGGGNE